MELWRAVRKHLEDAANAVGTLTALVAIGVYGATSALMGHGTAKWIAIAVFGFGGALEVFYRQRRAALEKRQQPGKHGVLFDELLDHKHDWKPKACEEFEYRGFKFTSFGFEQYPVPIAISTPRCPRCEKQLTFRAYVNWHGAVRSKVLCGFCAYDAFCLRLKK